MEIPKDRLVKMLRERGDHCKAELVEQQLPTTVDLERDADHLWRIGLNARGDLAARCVSHSSRDGRANSRASRAIRRTDVQASHGVLDAEVAVGPASR